MRVIQGDRVSYETLEAILANMKKHKWSAGEWKSWGGVTRVAGVTEVAGSQGM